jgi:hypothetical protein
MYTQEDINRANAAIRKDLLILVPILLALIAALGIGIRVQFRPVVYAAAALLFIVFCFFWSLILGPHARYRRFLGDMARGLSRTIECTIESIDEKTEIQDGAEVFPVHVLLDKEEDRRILYIAADKADRLPGVGEHMKADCYGRHIRDLED